MNYCGHPTRHATRWGFTNDAQRGIGMLKEDTIRPVEAKVAAAICRADGRFYWRFIRDTKGNPSTAYVYRDYLRMGRAAVRTVEKLYAGGFIGKKLKEERNEANRKDRS